MLAYIHTYKRSVKRTQHEVAFKVWSAGSRQQVLEGSDANAASAVAFHSRCNCTKLPLDLHLKTEWQQQLRGCCWRRRRHYVGVVLHARHGRLLMRAHASNPTAAAVVAVAAAIAVVAAVAIAAAAAVAVTVNAIKPNASFVLQQISFSYSKFQFYVIKSHAHSCSHMIMQLCVCVCMHNAHVFLCLCACACICMHFWLLPYFLYAVCQFFCCCCVHSSLFTTAAKIMLKVSVLV